MARRWSGGGRTTVKLETRGTAEPGRRWSTRKLWNASTENCGQVGVMRLELRDGSVSASSFQTHGELGYYARKLLIEKCIAAQYYRLRSKAKRRL